MCSGSGIVMDLIKMDTWWLEEEKIWGLCWILTPDAAGFYKKKNSLWYFALLQGLY